MRVLCCCDLQRLTCRYCTVQTPGCAGATARKVLTGWDAPWLPGVGARVGTIAGGLGDGLHRHSDMRAQTRLAGVPTDLASSAPMASVVLMADSHHSQPGEHDKQACA